jgi:uncharacterized protein YecT (DUF1311 family)
MRFVLAICVTCFIATSTQAASFHCAKKISDPMELVICHNPQLSKADEDLAAYYFSISKAVSPTEAKELLSGQREWLKQREKQCPSYDWHCLLQSYGGRIHVLKERYSKIVPLPAATAVLFQGVRPTCGFPEISFPQEFKIFFAGNYAGRTLDFQIDDSGDQATQFDVTVNYPEEPVVLLLGDYEPGIWNIRWSQGTQILAVVVSGYDRQIVLGLPEETPLLISRGSPCELSYITWGNIDSLNRISDKMFHRPSDGLRYRPSDGTFIAGAGKIMVGTPLIGTEKLIASNALTLYDFIDKSAPLAGPLALQKAVEAGVIRKSNGDERKEWRRRWKERHPIFKEQDKSFSSHPLISSDSTYVILKPFHIPPGLHGGLSAVFFLPDGVRFPEGEIGGATLYDMNNLICYGDLCRTPCPKCND